MINNQHEFFLKYYQVNHNYELFYFYYFYKYFAFLFFFRFTMNLCFILFPIWNTFSSESIIFISLSLHLFPDKKIKVFI